MLNVFVLYMQCSQGNRFSNFFKECSVHFCLYMFVLQNKDIKTIYLFQYSKYFIKYLVINTGFK